MNAMPKAILFSCHDHAVCRVYTPDQLQRIGAVVNLVPGVVTAPEQLSACGPDVELIFSTWGIPPLTEADLEAHLPKLKAVFYAAGSVQNFARPYLARGVRVFSAWRANAIPVAEYTVGQILLANKGYFRAQPFMRTDRIASRAMSDAYPGNYDARIGLLGCGAIGSLVARFLQAFCLEVLVHDPYLPPERAEALRVRATSMEEIFQTCSVISNHLPNLPSTVGLIRREHLLSMRPYSTFINTGRGPQLDERDLYDALTEDPTRTALLDVLTDEAHSNDNPLNALPNCLLTPHIAGSKCQELRRLGEFMIEALGQYQSGVQSPHEVFSDMLATMA